MTIEDTRKWGYEICEVARKSDLERWEGYPSPALIALRDSDPRQFGAIYDAAQSSAELMMLLSSPSIVRAACHFLDCDPGVLIVSGHMLRMDFPGDKRNALKWHRESSYYTQNLNDRDGCVVWLPLNLTDDTMGGIELIEMSGIIAQSSLKVHHVPASETSSEQFAIDDEEMRVLTSPHSTAHLASKIIRSSAIPQGCAVLFSMDTIHRTLPNESDRVRLTAGVRFHRADAEGFVSGRLIYTPNAWSLEQREKWKNPT